MKNISILYKILIFSNLKYLLLSGKTNVNFFRSMFVKQHGFQPSYWENAKTHRRICY